MVEGQPAMASAHPLAVADLDSSPEHSSATHSP